MVLRGEGATVSGTDESTRWPKARQSPIACVFSSGGGEEPATG